MSHDLNPICGPYHCGGKVENAVEERDNRNPKGDKVPLVETVFKEIIQFCLMPPPFWFSTLKSKIGYTHTTLKIINIRKSHLIF